MAERRRRCPNCGYEVVLGAPTCGNCAQDLRAPLASASRFGKSLIIPLAIFAGVVLLAGWLGVSIQEERIESAPVPPFTVELPAEEIVVETGPRRYPSVTALARALRRAGIPCRVFRFDGSGRRETTTCMAAGSRLSLTVFPGRGVHGQSFTDVPRPNVALVGRNWTVVTDDRRIAETIEKDLGARRQ